MPRHAFLKMLLALCAFSWVHGKAASLQDCLSEAVGVAQKDGVRYNQVWTPPGEQASLRMDCSNTAQWLLRRCEGVYLPRTASEQYLFLKQNGRLFRGVRDATKMRQVLRPGDLLFWENTYHPKRRPPVTHVMVYFGSDKLGGMWMAGAQTSRGVGIYEFHPEKEMGGYRIFFGLFKRHGRFVAYGRPVTP